MYSQVMGLAVARKQVPCDLLARIPTQASGEPSLQQTEFVHPQNNNRAAQDKAPFIFTSLYNLIFQALCVNFSSQN